ncbi:MAG: exodeoxyribonuclease VII small subunit [Ruminococcaceae bacterium]|jgi:exodeoxyribonuclease VII small subunit|nr:exodeoxyribonuclease VII small subunit [Oscillospiraceae bacterium]
MNQSEDKNGRTADDQQTVLSHSGDELQELTYEDALAALETVVARLESGDVTLDESMKLFQKGTELSRICTARLAAIEKQITQLLQSEDGTLEEKPFDEAN